MTTILVDMDGVLCEYEKNFILQMKSRYPEIPIFDYGKRTEADEPYLNFLRNQKEVQEVLSSDGFYKELEPVPGGLQALEEMEAAGYDVIICTAPALNNITCASDKLVWVRENLGEKWWHRTIITRDKTRVRGDILIDDKIHVKGALNPEWTHIIFEQSYNQADKTRFLLKGWPNWEKSVKEVLNRKDKVI